MDSQGERRPRSVPCKNINLPTRGMPLMQNVAVCLHEMLLVLRADAAFGKDPASSLGGKLKISPSILPPCDSRQLPHNCIRPSQGHSMRWTLTHYLATATAAADADAAFVVYLSLLFLVTSCLRWPPALASLKSI